MNPDVIQFLLNNGFKIIDEWDEEFEKGTTLAKEQDGMRCIVDIKLTQD